MGKILFSVNLYDRDGDIQERGVWLHFGDVSIKVAKSPADYQKFLDKVTAMKDEISRYE